MGNEAKDLLWKLVRSFEGCYLSPYLCPAGVATIGVGSTRYPDGRPVTLADQKITEEQAKAIAWAELNKCVRSALKYSPCLAEDERALVAISDFIYNLGAGAYQRSTLRKRINADDRDGAKVEIMKWNKAGGKVLRGLTARRTAEAALL